MRTWVFTLMLALTVLSGCAESGDTDPVDTASETNDSEDGAATTAPVTDVEEEATADEATQENVTEKVPLALSAGLDNETIFAGASATISLDGAGEETRWTILIDDTQVAEGTTLPASHTQAFDEAKIYLINVTLSDGEETIFEELSLTVEIDPTALVDMGWYIYDPNTELCEVKDYSEVAPGALYNSALGGGNWYIAESNDVPGLQVSSTHPAPEPTSSDPGVPECKGGDQIVY